jgi:micrococcal nuclease
MMWGPMSICSKICSLIFAGKKKKIKTADNRSDQEMQKNYYLYKATVVRVVDGDTVDLEIDLGMNVFVKERIRLARINTPETYGVKKDSEEYKAGMKAKERLEELVLGKEIALETVKDKKGKYGRYLGELYTTDTNWICINSLMINEGLAKPY